MKSRILVSVVGIPVLVWLTLWAPLAAVAVALAALSSIGAWELQVCVGGARSSRFTWLVAIMGAVSVLCACQFPDYTTLCYLVEGFVIFSVAVYMAGRVRFVRIFAALFSDIAVAWSFSAFLRIAQAGYHRSFLLLPFLLSFACDTFAFFTGLRYGRHRLAPRVSPKKTVEGSVGGLAGNVICGLAFALVMDLAGLADVNYGGMAILSLACGFVAQLGDLSFSLIKREFEIKDYGRIFFEHGGVLDRFDSVLFVAPMVEVILKLMR